MFYIHTDSVLLRLQRLTMFPTFTLSEVYISKHSDPILRGSFFYVKFFSSNTYYDVLYTVFGAICLEPSLYLPERELL